VIGLLLYFPFSELEQNLKTIVHASRSAYHIPRLNSIYHAPTLNGAYMSIAAAYFSIRFLHKMNLKTALALSIVLLSLLLSVSRGGILSYLIVLIAAIVLMREWKSSLILIAIMVVTVIGGLRLVNLSPDKASWIFKSSAETIKMEKDQTRVKLWDSTYSTLERHPFGLGLGKSGWIANRFVKESEVLDSTILRDKTLVISGTFSVFSREELKELIEKNGGKVASSVSSKTDYLVAGENMGPAKLKAANGFGVNIISEENFIKMISL
jgi:hypothetical protein